MSELIKVFVRSAYNYDREAASDAAGLACKDESLADQSFAEDADINVLVRRFGLTQALPSVKIAPEFGDFSGLSDFRECLDIVNEAQRVFAGLPAEVRKRFGHDPREFVDFASDDKNLPELVKMGLAVKREEPKAPDPVLVRVVAEEPKATK